MNHINIFLIPNTEVTFGFCKVLKEENKKLEI